MEEQATMSQHTEIILTLPTLEIVLKVTEIPPVDVFYSPLHKALVRRQRKKEKGRHTRIPTWKRADGRCLEGNSFQSGRELD